ncbi:hypothetical protein TNIN_27591 [Trichonephila inaurata madagascariensis]|uniref:Uncharacterized protein n=1 Tax=Trichonephila inaurata madagascariensis TaxID=2747483 RepID=A0A8X7CM40_9ARAC|nr:hypothetical protein TNIN_27591 [Trichonephila inaurata madagascariensis]
MTPPRVLSASIPKNAYQVSIVESKQRPLCEKKELFGRKGKCLQDGDKGLVPHGSRLRHRPLADYPLAFRLCIHLSLAVEADDLMPPGSIAREKSTSSSPTHLFAPPGRAASRTRLLHGTRRQMGNHSTPLRRKEGEEVFHCRLPPPS